MKSVRQHEPQADIHGLAPDDSCPRKRPCVSRYSASSICLQRPTSLVKLRGVALALSHAARLGRCCSEWYLARSGMVFSHWCRDVAFPIPVAWAAPRYGLEECGVSMDGCVRSVHMPLLRGWIYLRHRSAPNRVVGTEKGISDIAGQSQQGVADERAARKGAGDPSRP